VEPPSSSRPNQPVIKQRDVSQHDVNQPGLEHSGWPALPYVLPFAVFVALIGLFSFWHPSDLAELSIRFSVMIPVLWIFSRRVIDLRVAQPVGTVVIGLGIFAVWVVPDLLFPLYRQSSIFQNQVLGTLHASLTAGARRDTLALVLRTLRAMVIVPIVEELFWRAWLMRWVISPDFLRIPLGTYTSGSFWLVAVLFAAEHGPYWDVGLLAGILFNAWMIRTRSLGDLILAHAVANGALSVYVIAAGKWEFWQ
jgi:CAAX prenyl protease-like protein